MFTTFCIYMAEITVQRESYRFYEGFMVLGSVEFLMSITLTVDIWICPFAVFASHTYAFLRIYLQYDKVSDVLCPGLYTPLFHFTMSCHLFNLHSKKEFLMTEMQKEMIKRFISILKTFPERIIITQKDEYDKFECIFTNDSIIENNLYNKDIKECFESVYVRKDEISPFGEDNQQVELDHSVPLDLFLENERIKATDSETLITESKITSIAPRHFNPVENNDDDEDYKGSDKNLASLSRKHYTVKTKQIEWKQFINIDSELNARSGDNSHKVLSFLHIFIDNTERERLKYEKTLREYQRMMLSSVAHEFRNPLNAIQGNLQLIELNQDPKIKKYVKISKSSCTLLNSYVEDILDLGRIEGSAFQLNCDEFSIVDVIQEVYEIFEIELKRRNIDFQINISPRFSLAKVYTDRDRLRQVVINLVSNAIKFCNSAIKVECFQLNKPNDESKQLEEIKETVVFAMPNLNAKTAAYNLVRNKQMYSSDSVFISVTDDGDGIEPKDQAKLFKLFGKISKTHQKNK